LVAVSAGAPRGVVGFARFRREGDVHESLFIDVLYVHPSVRGQRVGSALLDAAVVAAAVLERRLFVHTAVARWYERRGWTVVQQPTEDTNFVLERHLAGI
jgi:predicted N-acetyltransferase YhbS